MRTRFCKFELQQEDAPRIFQNMKQALERAAALLLSISLFSCAGLLGDPSLAVLGRSPSAMPGLVASRDFVEESSCFRWFGVFFSTGEPNPTHESLIAQILEEHDADYLVDAELTSTTYGIPYLYLSVCTTVRGRPARLNKAART